MAPLKLVFVPWKNALNIYTVREFPLICHTLKGLSHYRIIECIHISIHCLLFQLPAGPFSGNVIYMAPEELSQTELTLHEGLRVIHIDNCDSTRQNNHCGG